MRSDEFIANLKEKNTSIADAFRDDSIDKRIIKKIAQVNFQAGFRYANLLLQEKSFDVEVV